MNLYNLTNNILPYIRKIPIIVEIFGILKNKYEVQSNR